MGLSTRRYVREKYLFNFGLTEYVATGRIIALTSGYREKNEMGMFYYGAQFSTGKYRPWGYFSYNLELGSFMHEGQAEEGVLRVGLDYFTELVEWGPWKLRQFVKPGLTIGFNRYGYNRLTLSDDYGMDVFDSPIIEGNSRLLLTTQTQTYAPWDFIGFHFGPYLNLSLGVIGDAGHGLQSGRLYSKIGLGVLIKNDNLAMNTFQLSLAYYPVIPGLDNNQLKFNRFKVLILACLILKLGSRGRWGVGRGRVRRVDGVDWVGWVKRRERERGVGRVDWVGRVDGVERVGRVGGV
ncbi:hypothetical protein [Geofilum rubicundum]|uniref:Bacterial surface antigen (D15) domain-containing protein n=1 Tax=Geofilum rubicundum JCM 15548 TaxID=1236989 RepID=A0A0E9M262_9BACT|nr:hypothetical protein [Geofilum rubicundum]GAO31461.1 hypothetical protein JCM15548_13825 [Geofilum rubicundum JCM 15548]